MNNTMNKEKLVEIKFNKSMWRKVEKIIKEKILLLITTIAIIFYGLSLVAMVEQWSISGIPLYINLSCLAWFIIFFLYIHFVVNG